MKIIITAILLLSPGILFAQDVQLFNPATFGQPINKPIVFLFEASSDAVKPLSILTDVKNGNYYAFTITYSREVTFESVKKAILAKHDGLVERQLGENFVAFRNETDKYAIQLSESKCYIQAIYVPFLTTEKIFESVIEVGECM